MPSIKQEVIKELQSPFLQFQRRQRILIKGNDPVAGPLQNNHPRAHYAGLQTNTTMSHKCLEMFLPWIHVPYTQQSIFK